MEPQKKQVYSIKYGSGPITGYGSPGYGKIHEKWEKTFEKNYENIPLLLGKLMI